MSVSKEEVLEMFREVARRFEDTDRKFQEPDRQIKETGRQIKETESLIQETEHQLAETDRTLHASIEELRRSSLDVDREIREVTKTIGRLGNRLGEFVEEMIRPALVRIFQERGIAVHEVYRRALSDRDGEQMEVDLLVVNDTDVIVVEVKSELRQSDVDEHLERMRGFKRMFPRYCDFRAMGAVAAMVIADNVAHYAYRKWLFVLGQSGDQVIIRNDLKFRPALW